MNQKLHEAIEHILYLHCCEQEGIAEGMPSAQEWIDSVNQLAEAFEPYRHAHTRE